MRSMLCVIFLHNVLESHKRVSVDLTDTYDRVDHPVYCDVWLGLRSTALSVCISCAELYGEYCRERRKVLNAVGACALRLALYAYARNFEPYSPLDPGISVLIQILNTILFLRRSPLL